MDAEVALDLTAETFAQAFAGRKSFRGKTPEEQEAWLYGIARNVTANYFRRGRAERSAVERLGIRVPDIERDDLARIEELADLAGLRRSIARQFDRLPHDQQLALQLRVIDECPYAEVASALCISEETARARVSRALRKLAGSLDTRAATEGVHQ